MTFRIVVWQIAELPSIKNNFCCRANRHVLPLSEDEVVEEPYLRDLGECGKPLGELEVCLAGLGVT